MTPEVSKDGTTICLNAFYIERVFIHVSNVCLYDCVHYNDLRAFPH